MSRYPEIGRVGTFPLGLMGLALATIASGCMNTSKATECFSDDECAGSGRCIDGKCRLDGTDNGPPTDTAPGDNVPTDEDPPGESCPLGAEGCSCRPDGGCDGLLVCLSKRCVDASGLLDDDTDSATGVDGTDSDTQTGAPWKTDGPQDTESESYTISNGSKSSDTGSATETETDTVSADPPSDTSPPEGLCEDFVLDGCGAPGHSPCVVYVNGARQASGTGNGWGNALKTIQEGIDKASDVRAFCRTDLPVDVWVAAGQYDPYVSSAADTIEMRPGVVILGGFAGSETDRFDRQPGLHPSVLTTQSVGVDVMVTASDDSTLDGFVFDGLQDIDVKIDHVSPTIANCTFLNSTQAIQSDYASPTLEGCRFVNYESLGDIWHNVANFMMSEPRIDRCVFSGVDGTAVYLNNSALTLRNSILVGAMRALAVEFLSRATVENSVFIGDRHTNAIGIVAADFSPVAVTNAMVTDYHVDSGYDGAGIGSYTGTVTVKNSIIWGNTGPNGSATSEDQLDFEEDSGGSRVTYSAVQGGWSGEGNLDADPLFMGFTNPRFIGTWTSAPRFDEDILTTVFTDANAHFTGSLTGMLLLPGLPDASESERRQRFYIVDNTETEIRLLGDASTLGALNGKYHVYDYRLGEGSPCIDAADGEAAPETDLFGKPRYDHPDVEPAHTCPDDAGPCVPNADIGAVEYTPQQS